MAKIEKIIIDVNGKIEGGRLIITLEEAKSLKAALDELLGEGKTVYVQPYTQPYVPWTNPITWEYPTITCCDNNTYSITNWDLANRTHT